MARKRYLKQFKIAAAQVILSGEMSVKQLSEELEIKDTTLRRWANEYEKQGDSAFQAIPSYGVSVQMFDNWILGTFSPSINLIFLE